MFKKVLIIDDEPATVELFSKFFQIKGYTAVGANNGTNGLLMAKVEQPDVVILDYMMPDMDGHEVLRQVRAIPELAQLPVVLVTAHADPEGPTLARKHGADGYLNKPVRFPDLLAELNRVYKLRNP